jgi:phosphoglucosamine mutase
MDGLISSSGFRGIALKEITPSFCLAMGEAISSLHPGVHAVGHDVRFSSPLLAHSLALGLNSGGSDVKYIGLAPTPATAFYSRGSAGGAMVTASHNPPEYNGVKLFDPRGASITLSEYKRIEVSLQERGSRGKGIPGGIRQGEGLIDYAEAVAAASGSGKGRKVGLDPGNGSTTLTADLIFRLIGIKAQSINIAPDGSFPGRGPEPNEGSLGGLSDLVRSKGLDVGFAFDGDGDRVAIVDEMGRSIEQDTALAFVMARSLKGRKGSVVVNVDTSAIVDFAVEAAGGRVIRSKVGDPYVLEAMLKHRAVAGGETCGAWIFPSMSLCPDGVLSSIVFLNLLDEGGMRASEVRAGLPGLTLRRKKIPCTNNEKLPLMGKLEAEVRNVYCEEDIITEDGVRVGFSDKSWVLVRPSGTEPALRVTAESPSENKTLAIMGEFVKLVERTKRGKK